VPWSVGLAGAARDSKKEKESGEESTHSKTSGPEVRAPEKRSNGCWISAHAGFIII
jgi:hypothetical protein